MIDLWEPNECFPKSFMYIYFCLTNIGGQVILVTNLVKFDSNLCLVEKKALVKKIKNCLLKQNKYYPTIFCGNQYMYQYQKIIVFLCRGSVWDILIFVTRPHFFHQIFQNLHINSFGFIDEVFGHQKMTWGYFLIYFMYGLPKNIYPAGKYIFLYWLN